MNDIQKKLSVAGVLYSEDTKRGSKDSMDKQKKDFYIDFKKTNKLKFLDSNDAIDFYLEYREEIKKNNYWSKEARVNSKCFDEYPRALAYVFVGTGCKLTQLRKFYYAIGRIERSIIKTNKDISEYQPNLSMLFNYAYDKQKAKRGVSTEFYKFLATNIKGITTSKELSTFKKHFETCCKMKLN